MTRLALSCTAVCAALLSPAVRAQAPAASGAAQTVPANSNGERPHSRDNALDVHAAIPLWPDGAPGAVGKAETDVPTIAIYLPAANPTHTAVVIAPGGGYQHLAMDHEGLQVAQWLNAHGVAAVVLKYRLGPTYHHPIELGDAQRAVRYVRSHAAQLDVAPNHIGMLGFSAGGHLAATAGTQFDAGNAAAGNAIDQASSRPDFLVLCYAVITMEAGATSHGGSVKYLLGDDPTPQQRAALSADEHVTAQTPPTFLWSTTDDATVPVNNTVLFYQALQRNNVSAEMHIFPHGRHGLGLAQTTPEVNQWPELLYQWMRANSWAQ